MEDTFVKTIRTPIGPLALEGNNEALCSISFSPTENPDSEVIPEILKDAERQLQLYFAGKLKEFDLNLAPEGTEFQRDVWNEVAKVPFGETLSYLDIAMKSGGKTYTRAVGLANGKNTIPIIIPCHRIIGTNGKLTGYAGGIENKRWLLLHEQSLTKGKTLF